MNESEINKIKSDFSNDYNINISFLTALPPAYDCFIQISPNNEYIAYVQNNSYKIFQKLNGNWKANSPRKIPFEEKTIKGINWSSNNKKFLIYGNINEHKSLIKVINIVDPDWNYEIEVNENIDHASFYPDSNDIVCIKSLVNTLCIYSLLKPNNSNSDNELKQIKREYYFLKFTNEKSINYIENNNNLFMILPCYGRKKEEGKEGPRPKKARDFIIILANKKVFKCFEINTKNLDRIVPIRKYSLFIVIEKEFYKNPFFILNLYGEIVFNSEFDKKIQRLLTNPCLLNNQYHENKFLIVQEPKKGKLDVFGMETNLRTTGVCFYFDYNKLFENSEKSKNLNEKSIKLHENNKNEFTNNKNNNYLYENAKTPKNDNYIEKDDIVFLEEQIIYNNKKNENTINNGIYIENKNKIRKLIKVDPFDIDINISKNNEDEEDYQLHAEISPINNYICFINKKYPKYLFFGCYYRSGVSKIIKFIDNIITFKWSSQQDILLVTFESCSHLYFITKENYLNYNLGENFNCNFDGIDWSSSGKDIIISDKGKNMKLVVSLL